MSVDSIVQLSSEESRHAIKARRLKIGDSIRLINGVGGCATATIVEHGRQIAVKVEQYQYFAAPQTKVTVAAALPKGDRQKTMMDMLVQLGVDELIPLECARSVARFSDSTAARWQRVFIEACKQSGRVWIPSIGQVRSVAELVESATGDHSRLYWADPNAAQFTQELSLNAVVAIGPEGGFDTEEQALFKQAGAVGLKLGSNILRTETAAVAALSVLNQARLD